MRDRLVERLERVDRGGDVASERVGVGDLDGVCGERSVHPPGGVAESLLGGQAVRRPCATSITSVRMAYLLRIKISAHADASPRAGDYGRTGQEV